MFSGRHSVEAPRLFSDRYMVTNPWVVKRKNLPQKISSLNPISRRVIFIVSFQTLHGMCYSSKC